MKATPFIRTSSIALFAMLALLVLLLPASAHAAPSIDMERGLTSANGAIVAQKVVTLKPTPIYQKDSLATQIKKAAKVSKTGLYCVKLKNGQGIIRFKAPKTKTYTFTFTNLASSRTKSLVCVGGFCVANSKNYSFKTIKTNEGKRPRVPIMSKALANGKSVVFDGNSYRRLAKRYAKIKVNKGKTIYIVLSARNLNDKTIPSSLRVKIA